MHSYRAIVDYLLLKGHVHPADVVAGDFGMTEASRRHRNVRVTLTDGRGLFLKIALDAERGVSIAREAEVYEFLAGSLPARLHDTLIVRAVSFDPKRSLLVLDLLSGFENLWQLQSRRRRFLPRVAKKLGHALAELHRASRAMVRSKLGDVPFHPMAIESLAPSMSLVGDCSDATLDLIRIIQSDKTLCDLIGSLQTLWFEEPESGLVLVHGDLRFENCCVQTRSRGLRLVDWEFAGAGDAMWDAGCVLASLLSSWLRHVPMPTGSQPDQYLRLSMPIASMKESARGFWLAYLGSEKRPSDEGFVLLERAMIYAAARLVQLAFEELSTAAQLTMHALSYLQLGRNLFERPVEGAIHLLGIPA